MCCIIDGPTSQSYGPAMPRDTPVTPPPLDVAFATSIYVPTEAVRADPEALARLIWARVESLPDKKLPIAAYADGDVHRTLGAAHLYPIAERDPSGRMQWLLGPVEAAAIVLASLDDSAPDPAPSLAGGICAVLGIKLI